MRGRHNLPTKRKFIDYFLLKIETVIEQIFTEMMISDNETSKRARISPELCTCLTKFTLGGASIAWIVFSVISLIQESNDEIRDICGDSNL